MEAPTDMSGIALWDHIHRLERLQHCGTFVFTAIEAGPMDVRGVIPGSAYIA